MNTPMDRSKSYWIVIPSTVRQYGYSIRDAHRVATYVVGPDFSCCWYKYKRDAIARCEALNKENHGSTKPWEYEPLLKELVTCGYDNLRVVSKGRIKS